VYQYWREPAAAQGKSETVVALSTENAFTEWMPLATSLRGWAIAKQGRYEEGIVQIREGLDASRATGAGVFRPYFLSLLAEIYLEMDSFDKGLTALAEALSITNEHEGRFIEAELRRINGELLLKQDNLNIAEAQSCFERAIEIAREQSAKSWELRATTSLARLLDKQGRHDEAHRMLTEIYNWSPKDLVPPT
jgi:predicted ATPase